MFIHECLNLWKTTGRRARYIVLYVILRGFPCDYNRRFLDLSRQLLKLPTGRDTTILGDILTEAVFTFPILKFNYFWIPEDIISQSEVSK